MSSTATRATRRPPGRGRLKCGPTGTDEGHRASEGGHATAALLTLALPPRAFDLTATAAVAVVAAAVGVVRVLPWSRMPAWSEAVPAFAFLVPVVLLRQATGGSSSGFAALAMAPVLWLALYGTRRQLLASLAAVALVFVGPLLLGVEGYTSVDWRRAVLAVLLAALAGIPVHSLVSHLARREHEASGTSARLTGVLSAVTEHAVVGTDRTGTIEVFNTGAERMLGWRAEDVVGRDISMLQDPTELAVRAARLGMSPARALVVALDHAPSIRCSWTYMRKDSSTLPVELTVSAVRDAAGQVIGYIGVAEDVSQRRAAEQRLRDSEANLTAIARVVRGVQTGRDARDAIVDGAMEAAEADGVFLFEPDGAGGLMIARSRGSSLTSVTLALDETSAAGATFLSGERLFIADPVGHPLASRRILDQVDVASVLFEPVVRRGEVVAVLVVAWASAVESVDARKASVIALLADEAALVLEHQDLVHRLETLAATDPLTGLATRRAWGERLGLEMARAAREDMPLTVALIDLDHFKAFNDTYGHQAGDHLLSDFAVAAGSVLRDVDLLARWGGEEFVVALPGCDSGTAVEVLGRVRATLSRQQTCSVGYAQWDGAESLVALLARADGGMYEAKQAGRDRMVVAQAAQVRPAAARPGWLASVA